ncbi:MAG TPA: LPS export ABC transporter permease LptF [Alphaproteobacteria bacterium]
MLLRRYLARQLLLSTLVIATGMTMVIWLTQSLRLLDLVINGGAPLQMFGYMLLLTIPRFFEMILPIALAISIVFLFNKLVMDSELVVMQACGFSPWQLARAVMLLSVVMGTVVFGLSGWVTPKATRELDQMRDFAKSGFSLNLLRAGVFNTLGDNVTIYLTERHGLDDLRGLLIHFAPAGKPNQTIWARRGGMMMNAKDEPVVIVYEGMRQQYNNKTNKVESLRFESYQVDLGSFLNKSTADRSHDPDQYNLPELFERGPTMPDAKQRRQFIADAHTRITKFFLVFSFALCAVTPFLLGRYNRRGQAWRVLWVIVLLVFLQAVNLGATAIAQKSVLGDVILYITTIIPALVCLWLLLTAHPAGQWSHQNAKEAAA